MRVFHVFHNNLRLNVNVVSPSILLSGSSKPTSTMSPSLTPQVTVISSRTWLPVPPKPIALSSLLPLVSVNSKLVSPRTVKPVNTPSWPSPLVSSNWSLVLTRWTPLNHHTRKFFLEQIWKISCYLAKRDSLKSHLKSPTTSRRSVTIQSLLLSSQSPAGTVTTWLNHPKICHGTRDGTRKWR